MTDATITSMPPKRNSYFVYGGIITFSVIIFAIVGYFWSPTPPNAVNFLARSVPPSLTYPLGTDSLGRDIFSRLLAGAWRSVSLGFGATAIGLVISVPLALEAAYRRGTLDAVLSRIGDVFVSVPVLVLALILVVSLGVGHTQAIIAIGLSSVPRLFRVFRGVALSIAVQDFITSATARGESAFYIQYREMLPNLRAPIIVEASIFVGFSLMSGAALSYLGLGTQPPAADWGMMIRDGQGQIHYSWWPLVAPAIFTSIAIVGFNLFGEGLHEVLDDVSASRS